MLPSFPEKGSRIDLDFDGGEVFAGHVIAAKVSTAGRVLGADIVG